MNDITDDQSKLSVDDADSAGNPTHMMAKRTAEIKSTTKGKKISLINRYIQHTKTYDGGNDDLDTFLTSYKLHAKVVNWSDEDQKIQHCQHASGNRGYMAGHPHGGS